LSSPENTFRVPAVRLAALLWSGLAVVAACDPPHGCPDGHQEVRYVCVPLDAGQPLCPPTGDYDGFGDPCVEQEDCACPSNVCNDQPGYEYCTQINCKGDHHAHPVCPPDWTCLDLEGLPGVPPDVTSICVRP
jgi:hypothetical protein